MTMSNPSDWNAMTEAGLSWDQAERMPTQHDGGLWLRTPKQGDVMPAPLNPQSERDMGANIRWLVMKPEIDEETAVALLRLVKRYNASERATGKSLLRALPSAWLAYQRGER